MNLIGEKWADYVEEKKEVLEGLKTAKENVLSQLKKLALYKFSLDIVEAHPDVDSGLVDYVDCKLSFIIKEDENKYTNQRIAIHFGDEFVPFVEFNPKDHLYLVGSEKNEAIRRIDLDAYLGLNKSDSHVAEKILKAFVDSIATIKI